MPITTIFASLGMGHEAQVTTPWVPIIFFIFIFAVVFLAVSLTWQLIKSRRKKQK